MFYKCGILFWNQKLITVHPINKMVKIIKVVYNLL